MFDAILRFFGLQRIGPDPDKIPDALCRGSQACERVWSEFRRGNSVRLAMRSGRFDMITAEMLFKCGFTSGELAGMEEAQRIYGKTERTEP